MLIDDVEWFLEHTGMSAGEFGHRFRGDPAFVYDLRGGRSPKESTAMEVRRRMQQYLWQQRIGEEDDEPDDEG